MKTSTAKSGNPREASRGAAVNRAKRELAAAVDAMLIEIEFSLYADVMGVKPTEVQERMNGATINDVLNWTEAMERRKSRTEAA